MNKKLFTVVFVNLVKADCRNKNPNLSLAYLSSYYKKHGKYRDCVKFKLIDENIASGNTVEAVRGEHPDLIGVSSTSMFVDLCREFVVATKIDMPGVPIIAGGIHFQIYPEYLLNEGLVDFTCTGEGEKTLCALIDLMVENNGIPSSEVLRSIPGLCFKDNQLECTTRAVALDADSMPDPDWDLIDGDFYFRRNYGYARTRIGRSITLFTSRGCPYLCAFCFNSLLSEKKVRFMSAARVIDMIKNVMLRYGVSVISFNDDLFIGQKKRVVEICEGIISSKLNVYWSCNARAELLRKEDSEMIKLMRRAGCFQMQFGFESGSDRVLKYLKGTSASVDKNQMAIDLVNSHGIDVGGYFMIGNPTETVEELEMTRQFVIKNRHKMAGWEIFIFTPVPGTPLWEVCRKNGMLKEVELSHLYYNMFTSDPNRLRVFSEHLSANHVMAVRSYLKSLFFKSIPMRTRMVWAISSFLSDPAHFGRVLTSYWRYAKMQLIAKSLLGFKCN